MHKSRITLFLHNRILVCASIGLSLTAQADTLLLTNSDHISGNIIELTASAIKIKTTYAGTLSLDTLAVKSFDTDKPQHWQINLKPHQTRIHSSDKNGHVSIGDKIYAIDELSLSPSQARWKKSGLLEASLDVDNDANRKEKLHINSELNLESKHWRNELKAEVKRDKEKDRTTEDTSELNYTLDYLFNSHWLARADSTWRQEGTTTISEYQYLGVGPGYRLWGEEKNKFRPTLLPDALPASVIQIRLQRNALFFRYGKRQQLCAGCRR